MKHSYTFYSLISILVLSVAILLSILLPSAAPPSASLQLLLRRLSLLSRTAAPVVATSKRSVYTSSTAAAMSDLPYAKERRIAELAVQRAAILTKRVYESKVKGTVTKDDKSPVTIADYGAQALVISALQHNFPDDGIVGEEEAGTLRQDEKLRTMLWELVDSVSSATYGGEASSSGTSSSGGVGSSSSSSEIGTVKNEADMLDMIDKGNDEGGRKGRKWALDPVDGTKGFLRGGQYAIALALMVDGEVQLGVLGCPNLPVDPSDNSTAPVGIMMSAVRGQGTALRPLSPNPSILPDPMLVSMSPLSVSTLSSASFCESVESGHSSHSTQATIAQRLGITKPSVRMDSQAKYASIARGDGDIYLRLPVSESYEEKIWDHAAGVVIVEEAGGVVTDMHGQKLDFGKGRTLKSKGVVAAGKDVYREVVKVVGEVIEEEKKKSSL